MNSVAAVGDGLVVLAGLDVRLAALVDDATDAADRAVAGADAADRLGTVAAAGQLRDRTAAADAHRRDRRRQRLRLDRLAAHAEAGGDDGDADLVAHALVDHGAEDDVGVLVRLFLDQRRGVVDLVQREIGAAGDVDQHAARAADATCPRAAGSRSPAAPPRWRGSRRERCREPMIAMPISHMIVRTSAKSRLIRPCTVTRSEMPRTACSRTSSALRKASSIDVLRAGGGEQALVGDHDQRVDRLLQLARARPRPGACARLPSKSNGLVTTPTDSAPELARDAPDHRRAAGAGAAAHAGGDEHHVGAGRDSSRIALGVLLGGGAADLRLGAGAEPLCAELELDRRQVVGQRLRVGVGDDELDPAQTGRDHGVDRVAAAAAHADDLDAGAGAFVPDQLDHLNLLHPRGRIPGLHTGNFDLHQLFEPSDHAPAHAIEAGGASSTRPGR